jgi:hypothetical protein
MFGQNRGTAPLKSQMNNTDVLLYFFEKCLKTSKTLHACFHCVHYNYANCSKCQSIGVRGVD